MLFRFGPEDLHGMRILIVEDEYLLAADLAEAMRARGAEVIGPAAHPLPRRCKAVESNWIRPAPCSTSTSAANELRGRRPAGGGRDLPYVIATGCSADALPERFRGKPRLKSRTGWRR